MTNFGGGFRLYRTVDSQFSWMKYVPEKKKRLTYTTEMDINLLEKKSTFILDWLLKIESFRFRLKVQSQTPFSVVHCSSKMIFSFKNSKYQSLNQRRL